MATEATKIPFVEAAAPATPAASRVVVYAKADGLMYSKDDAGAETLMSGGVGGGSVATDAIWDAAGDLAQGTGANTAAKLASGAAGTVLTSPTGVGSAVAWAIPRLTFTLGPWYLNDIPGTATTQMLLMYMNTTTAVSQGGSSNSDFLMRTGGKVVGALLITDNSRTAGSATLQVRIGGTPTSFNSDAVALDAGATVRESSFVTYANGLAFAADAAIGVALVTSGYTPTTGNALAWLVVSLDVA